MSDPVRQNTEFGKDFGLVHEAIITGRKVGANQEFWSTLAHNEELFLKVVSIVLPRCVGLSKAEQKAANILGSSKVFGYVDVCRVLLGQHYQVAEPVLPYSANLLRWCAKKNKTGSNWNLIYTIGLSFRELGQFIGHDRKKQPCINPDFTWWLLPEKAEWTTRTLEPSYQLLDLSGRHGNRTWDQQSVEISRLGDDYERAEDQIVAETCVSMSLIDKEQPRPLEEWYHWGPTLTPCGNFLVVGYFNHDGLIISKCPSYRSAANKRVVVYHKPDLI